MYFTMFSIHSPFSTVPILHTSLCTHTLFSVSHVIPIFFHCPHSVFCASFYISYTACLVLNVPHSSPQFSSSPPYLVSILYISAYRFISIHHDPLTTFCSALCIHLIPYYTLHCTQDHLHTSFTALFPRYSILFTPCSFLIILPAYFALYIMPY